MLIEIDASVIDYIENQPDEKPEIVEILAELARARKHGENILFASREVLKKLCVLHDFRDYTKSVYKAVLEESSQLHSLLGMLTYRIVLKSPDYPISVINESNSKTIYLPITFFEKTSLRAKVVLLAENRNDADFFVYVAKTYIASQGNNLRRIVMDCECRGGGGSTTANEYKAIQDDTRGLCLCIADSDKKTPDDSLGDTARNLILVDSDDCVWTHLHIMGARFIESMFPLRILSECFSSAHPETIRFLEAVDRGVRPESRLFFNMKKGLTYWEIAHNGQGDEHKHYWKEVVDSVGGCLPNDVCQTDLQCASRDKCDCYIVRGFGNDAMDTVRNILPTITPHKMNEALCDHLRPEWEKIGELVTAWCIVGPKIRV